ncbi:MAG: hypothetical protein IOC39_11965 [Burkholderia sp.]|jgi:hypothetical protein|uniref:hypothetical protein n=1 Tax=Burkholderia TaxID=32008 RepID=UPI001CA3E09E|nr:MULTISPECIES: hypothetical protein [Burkholderia]MBY8605445.1 hypothetical protein [Burkholderia arboris]MCA3777672.1 hypothetical protein [Burkholderia sp.]MCA3783758.1 hypothetical protein [Burkholderia sp.]MCA3792615.1 hypothetical protein [Burkholderia sp.]MCA3806080.1 hypothetical protein [Burkholderia sp.]
MDYAGWVTGVAIPGTSSNAASDASNAFIVSLRVTTRFVTDDVACVPFTSELRFMRAALY